MVKIRLIFLIKFSRTRKLIKYQNLMPSKLYFFIDVFNIVELYTLLCVRKKYYIDIDNEILIQIIELFEKLKKFENKTKT